MAAAVLMVIGAALHAIGLFPNYYSGSSYSGRADEIALTVITVLAWCVAAYLALNPPRRLPQAAAFLAVGLALTEVGFRAVDLAVLSQPQTDISTGLWLTTIGWGFCSLGAIVAVVWALRARPGDAARGGPVPFGRPAFKPRMHLFLAGATAVVSVLLAVAYLPVWSKLVVVGPSVPGGRYVSRGGNAFDGPAVLVAANMTVTVVFALVPIIAVLWKPGRAGAWLLGGLLTVTLAELLSQGVEAIEAVPSSISGITPSTAQADHLTVSLHLTGWFYAELAFALLLVVALMARVLLGDGAPAETEVALDSASWPSAPSGYFGPPAAGGQPGAPSGQAGPTQGQPVPTPTAAGAGASYAPGYAPWPYPSGYGQPPGQAPTYPPTGAAAAGYRSAPPAYPAPATYPPPPPGYPAPPPGYPAPPGYASPPPGYGAPPPGYPAHGYPTPGTPYGQPPQGPAPGYGAPPANPAGAQNPPAPPYGAPSYGRPRSEGPPAGPYSPDQPPAYQAAVNAPQSPVTPPNRPRAPAGQEGSTMGSGAGSEPPAGGRDDGPEGAPPA